MSYPANRKNIDEIVERFPHESIRHSIRADLALINALDAQVDALESYLTRTAKIDDAVTYHLLRTVPGIGKVIALILLYEVQDIGRFERAGNAMNFSGDDCVQIRKGRTCRAYNNRCAGNISRDRIKRGQRGAREARCKQQAVTGNRIHRWLQKGAE